MKNSFHIGTCDGVRFKLPLDAVTQTFAIIAKRGVGKTTTAVVMAEEMISAGMQVVIIDPLDCWYGLRSSADGKSDGLPIIVIGGEHGDLPLNSADGRIIADFIVDYKASVVLSVRHLSNQEGRNFVAAFLDALYDRKGESKNRTPLHLIIDEADAYAPQRLFPGTERCFGAVDRIVRRGRSSGLGVTLISQRSAAINKDCLTQSEVMVALRTISPQDRKAIEAWIDAHDAHDQHALFMESLASLPIGTAWFWSPGWLEIFQKVEVRARQTFDSSATPKIGEKAITPSRIAAVDIEGLRTKLAATIEKKKADDPATLRKIIKELQARVDTKIMPSTKVEIKEIQVPFFDKDIIKRISILDDSVLELQKSLHSCLQQINEKLNALQVPAPKPVRYEPNHALNALRKITAPLTTGSVKFDATLGKCERAILAVLKAYPHGKSRSAVAVLAGYRVSGGFRNSIYSLRSAGCIVGEELLQITPHGMEQAAGIPDLPTGLELRHYWLGQLGKCAREILNTLIEQYPAEMTREELAAACGYTVSGGFRNSIYFLRTGELIEGKDRLKASDLLF